MFKTSSVTSSGIDGYLGEDVTAPQPQQPSMFGARDTAKESRDAILNMHALRLIEIGLCEYFCRKGHFERMTAIFGGYPEEQAFSASDVKEETRKSHQRLHKVIKFLTYN